MSQINTISEFLLHAGTNYRIFDLGRAIRPLPSQLFLDIELGKIPAPYPRQQHGWFGVVFFNPNQTKNHYVWFIKLPLDEQGLVINAARQQFLQIVVEALGQQLEKDQHGHNQLPENPFTFVPTQQQLADFNSISRRSLNLPPSSYYQLTAQYVQNPQLIEWQNLSLQGIADVLAFDLKQGKDDSFIQQFKNFAPAVQIAFCNSFENQVLEHKHTEMLLTWFAEAPFKHEHLIAVLRALSQSNEQSLVNSFIHDALKKQDWVNKDVLIIIAARHWQSLHDAELMSIFIHHLANCDNEFFSGLYQDLVQVPDTREKMLAVLRWPDKPAKLVNAIEQLFMDQNV